MLEVAHVDLEDLDLDQPQDATKTKYIDIELKRELRRNALIRARRLSMMRANNGNPLTEAQSEELMRFASSLDNGLVPA